MTAKQTADKALKMLHELKGLCYSEQSNYLFDELYDTIYVQCLGLSEAMAEADHANDWDEYFSEFLNALAMAKKIKAYYKASDIDWIYC